MKVAVTGASGFCGRYTVLALLKAGHEVLSLGRTDPQIPGVMHITWEAGLITSKFDVEKIVHLAAKVGDGNDRSAFAKINITGTAKLLRTGVPMILISTASVYSGSTVARKEDEAKLYLPSPYAWSKRQAELLAEAQEAVILRPRAVYGPGDPHLEPRLLSSLQGSVIRLPGSNRQMSLTHVNNLADAIVASLNWESGYYNIADTVVYSRDEVIASLLHSRGLSARVRHIPKHLAILLTFLPSAVPSRYAIEQLANPVILDLTRSLAAGYAPRFSLTDYLNNIQDGI